MRGKKAFGFWKNSCLPAKIQLILLKICNHQLRLNNQLKHYAVDERGVRVREDCTFWGLGKAPPRSAESYTHFFLECDHSMNTLRPVATKFNIPLPNLTTKGELVLYYFPWEGYWDELCINIFFAIFKYYLLRMLTIILGFLL